jgi:flagellar protein FlaG
VEEIIVSYLPKLPKHASSPRERHALAEGLNLLNEAVTFFDRRLKFYLHEKSGRVVVAVVNTQTNKVIKEIPPKEFLDVAARIKEIIRELFE